MDELDGESGAQASFALSTDVAGDPVVKVSGELDINAVDALAAQVDPVLARHPARLIVDVSDLRFADSSAIALWVRWATVAGQLELRNPSPLLRRVISGMGLADKLAVRP